MLKGYDKADMSMDSPVEERVSGLQAQPPRLRSVSKNTPSGFSRSSFFMSPCLTTLLRPGAQTAVFITSQGGGHGD
ncbi:MAG: hypothetical protein DRH43_07095 [Deltaproteobacteria bacterium]|nr:MAG: hypothetical protein DRH43_07095 [Deltaproteobacteria bacterium]